MSDTDWGEGAQVTRIVMAGSDVNTIAADLREAMARADLVLVTDGLGLTSDDLPAEVAAQILERGLSLNKGIGRPSRRKFRR
ncbi:MAG: molybdopterin-binding protein [Deltaproteobacteria bacterium]|nr:molybdopterin-binding protein [Deltaproteobacteria bacterium]